MPGVGTEAIYQNCISFSSLSNLKIYVDLLRLDTHLRPSYGILRQKGKMCMN